MHTPHPPLTLHLAPYLTPPSPPLTVTEGAQHRLPLFGQWVEVGNEEDVLIVWVTRHLTQLCVESLQLGRIDLYDGQTHIQFVFDNSRGTFFKDSCPPRSALPRLT